MRFLSILFTLSIICFYISACGLPQPRSTTMCYDQDKMKYTNCPDGYRPGDIIR